MDKAEHASRLRAAMAALGLDRQAISDATGKRPRSVTNWTTGAHMPDETDRAKLRRLLGDYDTPGDPVEIAVRASELTSDRQHDVIGYYLKRLREQREDGPRAG